MAHYIKNTVNTALAIPVIPSDTVPILNPSCVQYSGSADRTVANKLYDEGNSSLIISDTTSSDTTDKLVDLSVDFTVAPTIVKIKNQVINTTASPDSYAIVTAIDTATILSIDADIFQNAPEDYKILGDGFATSANPVKVGDYVLNLTDLTMTTVSSVDSDCQLGLADDIMASGEEYQIFSADKILGGLAYDEGALVYVGSNEGTMDVAKSFVDVKVQTYGQNDVIFQNVAVGSVLPVQCIKVYSTGTDAAVKPIAMW